MSDLDILTNNHFEMIFDGRYDELTNRKGWRNIWWERSQKCACYSSITGNPDYKDPICGGTGYLYTTDTNVEITNEIATVLVPNNKVQVACSYLPFTIDSARAIVSVQSVYNVTQNITYTIVSTLNNVITISGSPLPVESDVIKASYTYARDANEPLRAITSNIDYQNSFIPIGEWQKQDIILTVPNVFQKMGFRDRITIKDNFLRTQDLLRRFDLDVNSVSREKLMYAKNQGINIIICRDKYNTFIEDTDFQVQADGTISWTFTGASGNRPNHKSFRVQYIGVAVTATMTISATTLTLTIGGVPTVISFATYPTVQELADYIKTLTGFTTSVVISDDAKEIDNQVSVSESTTKLVQIATPVDIKTAAVQVWGEDDTQYSIEYMHYAIYSIFQQVGQVRLQQGRKLPCRFWLRLWEPSKRTSA